MLNIQESGQVYKTALLHLGFRPFFLGAGLFAIMAMVVWALVFVFGCSLALNSLSPVLWHGHEMIYGYSLAVIAGFLLTAVRNWTGVNTLHGVGLLLLFLLWAACRLLLFLPVENALVYMAVTELLFISWLFIAVLIPVVKVKQWKQLGVLVVLLLFFVCDGLFYLAVLGKLNIAPQTGLYLGLYLVMLMVFVMARRVIPFFIEKGVGYELKLVNWLWLDVLSLILFVIFALLDVFAESPSWAQLLALLLVLLHGIRLAQWHSIGIWRKPLLWVLYLAYAMFVLGFLLKSMGYMFAILPTISMHAFAVGGIGMMTVGMMARVALGHTGRNVFAPPGIIVLIFLLMLFAALVRAILPLFMMHYYDYWIFISQLLWISSFAVFIFVYAPMLIKPRIDGQYG